MRWTPCGPRAALIQFPDDIGARAGAIGRLLADNAEVVDFSIAFDKLLLEFSPEAEIDATSWLARFEALGHADAFDATTHEIPVVYDGLDLVEVAERHELTVEALIELHAAPVYEVAMLGFSPGFPYLTGLNPRLHTPRRAQPRSRVPVGAVAIGGSHAGIYSVESPGGWNLIGTTPVRLFDPARRDPDDEAMFLLRPGDRVKFVRAT